MARELERAVVALVREILDAELVGIPAWLVRPGKAECGERWPLVQEIYADLTGGMVLPEVMRPVERREVDAVLHRPVEPPRILEVDESQHFNHYRAATLGFYTARVPLAFPADVWIEHSKQKTRLEGGGWGAPKPPLFPGEGGRHRQRAFRDALSDVLPPDHGFLPTLRIADFEVNDWLHKADAAALDHHPDAEALGFRRRGGLEAEHIEKIGLRPRRSQRRTQSARRFLSILGQGRSCQCGQRPQLDPFGDQSGCRHSAKLAPAAASLPAGVASSASSGRVRRGVRR